MFVLKKNVFLSVEEEEEEMEVKEYSGQLDESVLYKSESIVLKNEYTGKERAIKADPFELEDTWLNTL